jgi:hypothetical protein
MHYVCKVILGNVHVTTVAVENQLRITYFRARARACVCVYLLVGACVCACTPAHACVSMFIRRVGIGVCASM